MTISEIKLCPTIVYRGPNTTRVHESVLRSYQTLEKVKELLKKNCPADIILEIIDSIYSAGDIEHKVV